MMLSVLVLVGSLLFTAAVVYLIVCLARNHRTHHERVARIIREEQEAPKQDDSADAARFRYLTEDIADHVDRHRRNELLQRMAVMSYSAACLDIDIAMSERAALVRAK